MFWGKGPDKPTAETSGKVAGASTSTEYDSDKLPASKSLPRNLQKIVDKEDKEDNFYDELISG